jgi:hypothetical protein
LKLDRRCPPPKRLTDAAMPVCANPINDAVASPIPAVCETVPEPPEATHPEEQSAQAVMRAEMDPADVIS